MTTPVSLFFEVQAIPIPDNVYQMLLENGSLTVSVVRTLKVFSLSQALPNKKAIEDAKELFTQTLEAEYGDQYGVTDTTLLGIRSILGSHSLYSFKADVSLLIP